MIGLVAVSFTLIGYSLEEVFSPKLRKLTFSYSYTIVFL